MKNTLLAIALSLASASALAQPAPLEMKGFALGDNMSMFSNIMLCTSIEKNKSYVCLKEHMEWGPTTAKIYFTGFDKNGPVVRLRAVFPHSDFNSVIEALTTKYGKPSSSTDSVVENRMGAKFDNKIVEWDFGNKYISASQRSTNVSESMVIMTTREADKEGKERSSQSSKESAKNL